MKEKVQEIINILKSQKLSITTEKELQREIEMLFKDNGLDFEREYRLDNKNIVDFYIDGLSIEVKIKAGKKAIYKQCERYCNFHDTKALLLITNTSMGFPEQINNKDCYLFSLGESWL